MRILLVSSYELGHQPLHVASPAAVLLAEGHEVRCVDLANFGIEDEELRGQGEFTAFLEKAERIAQELDRTVFVESLVNEQLYHFLCRRGYVPTTPDEDWNGASLYKKVT